MSKEQTAPESETPTISKQRLIVAIEGLLKKKGLLGFTPVQNCAFCPGSKPFSTSSKALFAKHLTKKHRSCGRAKEQASHLWETLVKDQETLCRIHNIAVEDLANNDESSAEEEMSADEKGESSDLEEDEDILEEEPSRQEGEGAETEKAPEKKFTCDECGQTFARMSNYMAHINKFCKSELECRFCRKLFTRDEKDTVAVFNRRVLTHQYRCRGGKPPKPESYMCSLCSKIFKTLKKLNRHLKSCTTVHDCKPCGRVFKTNHSKKKHQAKCRRFKALQKSGSNSEKKSAKSKPETKTSISSYVPEEFIACENFEDTDFVGGGDFNDFVEIKDEPLESVTPNTNIVVVSVGKLREPETEAIDNSSGVLVHGNGTQEDDFSMLAVHDEITNVGVKIE